jgi:ankyrin repeat protein
MNQPLHVAYAQKNQKAFRQLLDRTSASTSGGSLNTGAGGLSCSGPRSWTLASVLGGGASTLIDVNVKDSLGRTVLHRACSSLEPSAIDYVRMLLDHPMINVNVQDTESRWTALHRSLYEGNIMAAVLLLQRSDVDISLKVCASLECVFANPYRLPHCRTTKGTLLLTSTTPRSNTQSPAQPMVNSIFFPGAQTGSTGFDNSHPIAFEILKTFVRASETLLLDMLMVTIVLILNWCPSLAKDTKIGKPEAPSSIPYKLDA